MDTQNSHTCILSHASFTLNYTRMGVLDMISNFHRMLAWSSRYRKHQKALFTRTLPQSIRELQYFNDHKDNESVHHKNSLELLELLFGHSCIYRFVTS